MADMSDGITIQDGRVGVFGRSAVCYRTRVDMSVLLMMPVLDTCVCIGECITAGLNDAKGHTQDP